MALITLLDVIAFSWVQAPGAPRPNDIPWWQVVTGILAIPAGLLGLYYTYVLSQKTRWETREVKRRILKEEGQSESQTASIYQDALTSPRLVAASTQDFVIRFLIFYLAGEAWWVFQGFISPFIIATTVHWFSQPELNASTSWLAAYGLNLGLLFQWAGNLLIFIVLRLPLLKDVTRVVGGNVLSLRSKSRITENVQTNSHERSND